MGFLVFPRLNLLDLAGPLQVLSYLPGASSHLLWKDLDPVAAECGLRFSPTDTFDACPPLDLLCVPGGAGVDALLADEHVLGFLRHVAPAVRYVTSVCTGSLLLGAAGLLGGRRAACHWRYRDLLTRFGAQPSGRRVEVDGNIVTGGGVTAGIDFALTLGGLMAGSGWAEAVQLGLEYDPAPPYGGSPSTARGDVVDRETARTAVLYDKRRLLVEAAAERLSRG
ncbi:MAG: DJ-1/PfpI family protein [Magnetospirillum sp.]|nr:DJ-1/PfpI family protein [Magnetospirillum sp.]